jgi:ribonuclease HI
MNVHIYTDGACSGNPGNGGYGIIMEWVDKPDLLPGKSYKKEFSQGFKKTTNNRMELLAVIVALEQLKKEGVDVTVFSDSKYVVDSVTKGWINNWVKKGFKNIKNTDLWKRFLKVYGKHKVNFKWVKGHNDHLQNERCDRLAVKASQQKELLTDEGFENKPQTLF